MHEKLECVIDLVRNLRYTDPSSPVLLYNGGTDHSLLDHHFPFEDYGAVVYPDCHPLQWGRLHDFALDCMRFALEHYTFDTLTIVDSDQLALRPGYSSYLGAFLAGRQKVGLLGNAPSPQRPETRIGPAAAAFQETDLWRPLLRRFPQGHEKFVYWSFWPSTVFTADAARDLTGFFASDSQIQEIVERTKIWASEEVILPTVVALLGYEIAANPCSYRYVNYRVPYSLRQVRAAMQSPDAYWIHPVSRRLDDPIRAHIRDRLDQYRKAPGTEGAMVSADIDSGSTPLPSGPILKRMKEIDGWLDDDEADLLIAVAARSLSRADGSQAIVEVGSYCGKSTVVLGSVVKAARPEARVYAIDPHDGRVGAMDRGITSGPPTRATFDRNIAQAGVADVVLPIQSYPFEVTWDRPIGLLLIDGLHDYANVARDFSHFAQWVEEGGYVAFHDYASYYPGVQAFVDDLLASQRYRKVHLKGSLMVLEKLPPGDPIGDGAGRDKQPDTRPVAADVSSTSRVAGQSEISAPAIQAPLVSCAMVTCNRRPFVPQAITYFLRQDYPNRELIVIDDGDDGIADLIPADSRIRYVRLEGRHTVGAKRNLACEVARGEIIAHWDDDDWMADRRLSYEVGRLLDEEADVCGLASQLFYDAAADRAWRYVYSDSLSPWLSGGTLCYTRELWKKNPFADVTGGEDARFVWSAQRKHAIVLEDESFYVGLVHSGNASPKHTTGVRWHPYPADEIHRIMGEDRKFCAALAAEQSCHLADVQRG